MRARASDHVEGPSCVGGEGPGRGAGLCLAGARVGFVLLGEEEGLSVEGLGRNRAVYITMRARLPALQHFWRVLAGTLLSRRARLPLDGQKLLIGGTDGHSAGLVSQINVK